MKEIVSKVLPMMVKANEILQGKDITSEEKSGVGNMMLKLILHAVTNT